MNSLSSFEEEIYKDDIKYISLYHSGIKKYIFTYKTELNTHQFHPNLLV